MGVFKRGGRYWYEFVFNGKRIRESTKQSNKRVAEQIEAAHKTRLAKAEVGIHERAPAPTLKEFAERFAKNIAVQCADKPNTISFYMSKAKAILSHSPLANARLDAIDEAAIDHYVQTRSSTTSRQNRLLSPASINRELATLRRMLRLAHEWRIISYVPRIRLLRGERQREFVLSHELEPVYLAACSPILADVAVLLLDTGLRLGEALTLEWSEIHTSPAENADFGHLTVLARKAKNRRTRNVPLSERAVEVLLRWEAKASTTGAVTLVFHRPDGRPLSDSLLGQQHDGVRKTLKLPAEFVIHSLRHTFGTRLGEAGADAFTIMRLMGHSSLSISQRYVHPTPESVQLAFGRLMSLNKSRSTKK